LNCNAGSKNGISVTYIVFRSTAGSHSTSWQSTSDKEVNIQFDTSKKETHYFWQRWNHSILYFTQYFRQWMKHSIWPCQTRLAIFSLTGSKRFKHHSMLVRGQQFSFCCCCWCQYTIYDHHVHNGASHPCRYLKLVNSSSCYAFMYDTVLSLCSSTVLGSNHEKKKHLLCLDILIIYISLVSFTAEF